LRLPVERADLDVILGVILLPRQFLCRDVFGIAPPGAQAFFMLEFDNGYPLAVVSEKAFVRNVARHSAGELGHAIDQGDVFVSKSGFQARAKQEEPVLAITEMPRVNVAAVQRTRPPLPK